MEGARPFSLADGAPPEVRVLLTIDLTAGDTRWQDLDDPDHAQGGGGLRYMLRLLAQHALKACFFVAPVAGPATDRERIVRTVTAICEAGQEIQLLFDAPSSEGSGPVLADLDGDAQRVRIERARALLVEAGAPEPVAFRAAGCSANDDTLSALAALGFRFDSSHNGYRLSRPSAIGLPSDQVGPVRHRGIVEVPVTLIADGRGTRPLRISAVSTGELRAAMEQARDHGLPLVHILMRGSDLANRAGMPNRVRVRRFEDMCAFLSKERKRFPTAFFAELDDLPLDGAAGPLPNAPLRRMGRLIEQVWSNRIEERAS